MSDNVVTFPGTSGVASNHDFRWRTPSPRPNLRFLSKDRILESDEADLIHDVSCNLDRARTKLALISKRLTGLKQQSAHEIEQLTEGQKTLSAAISAAQEKPKPGPRKSVPVARKEAFTAADFIRTFREGLANAMHSGKDVWQVLDDVEDSAAWSERFRARQDCEAETEAPVSPEALPAGLAAHTRRMRR